MALQYSVPVRNARLDAVETTIGASAIMQIRSGSPPANCAAADTGTLLAEISLGADWMAAASAGSKAKNGTWQDLSANGTGTAGHFRIYQAGSPTVCHIQGTVSGTGGGGDMELDNTSLSTGQQVTVSSFAITAANA